MNKRRGIPFGSIDGFHFQRVFVKLGSRIFFIGFLGASICSAAVSVGHLRCEHAVTPLGIDVQNPSLSWILESDERGQKQTAYRILAASSPELLAGGTGDLWDSGKIPSGQSVNIPYAGKPLKSRQRCHWKVFIWDAGGDVRESREFAWWEMGLLSPNDWKAAWIGYAPGWNGRALYFLKALRIEKTIQQARAYIAGLGCYELRINGKKVGDNVLDPGITDYQKRVVYVTHDIGEYLLAGENAVGVTTGNGWYGMPKLLMQIELTYSDGSVETIATSAGWAVAPGPILRNGIYDGETCDARLEKPGWDLPSKEEPAVPVERSEGWTGAHPVDAPSGVLVSQKLEPEKVVETFHPKTVSEPSPGTFVFDTGQNLAGWARIRVKGERGTRITLKFAESLYDNGTVNQENLRQAACTDVYILKGGDVEEWEPRFTYHGFRYVQIEGWPGQPATEDVDIRVVRSAVESAGSFKCSSALLNRIENMVRWTEASNLHAIPTDCPQRDERMGWMNDLTVRIEQALYHFDLSRFYAKFIDDVGDTQDGMGRITDTVPFKWGSRPADAVSSSYLLLAWMPYLHYGDRRPIAEHYAGLKAWTDFLAGRTENGIVDYSYYGDWCPPVAFGTPEGIVSGAVSRDTPGRMMSTGYLFYDAKLISQMAGALGNDADRQTYSRLAENTALAYNREYWNEKTGGYASNNQASNSFALFLGLVPEKRIPRVVENLSRDVKNRGFHLTTGNLCTKYLLEVLTENGHAELAFRIAAQETYPGWGYMLNNGATTLWERWEHMTGGDMNSHNHPMMGSVGSWFHKYLAGIRVDPASPGFQNVIIKPYLIPDLQWVKGVHETPYGPVRCEWTKEAKIVSIQISIPPNATSTVFLPTHRLKQVTESGRPIEAIPWIRVLRMDKEHTVLQTASGKYSFSFPAGDAIR
jgi:alpha-L-rhamnosidase